MATCNHHNSVLKKLKESGSKGYNFFKDNLLDNGEYALVEDDISAYYKHPMMYLSYTEENLACSSLTHIKNQFYLNNGDFKKSKNTIYDEFYTYTNGWIIRATEPCNMKNLSEQGMSYINRYFSKETGGFFTNPTVKGKNIDVISTAHSGMINMEAGNLDIAKSSGNYLCSLYENQPSIENTFYLRSDVNINPITTFPSDQQKIFSISVNNSVDLYFMLGYPIAFLSRLYTHSRCDVYLEYARKYADFLLRCNPQLLSSEFSHKVAWALSELYVLTNIDEYFSSLSKIVEYFLDIQTSDGVWFQDEKLKCYDQSPEVIIWFKEIEKNINTYLFK